MTTDTRSTLLLPILLITIGSGWLLTTLGVAPGIDWVWTLGLGVVGVLVLAMGGVDKATIVIGPFFILASCMSVLRQTGRLHVDIEIPLLVIAAGLLLLVARHPSLPVPKWMNVNSTRN